MSVNPLVGRWDAVVQGVKGSFPTWFEIKIDGTGHFVGQFGSARPIAQMTMEGDKLTFSLPPQYEERKDAMRFEGVLSGEKLAGTTTDNEGQTISWEAKRSPELPYRDVRWGAPTELIGSDLSNWTLRSPDWESNWSIVDGTLTNAKAGSDLITTEKFEDFRLVCEYKYPAGSNSGIYLRGRYEVQILDDHGKPPSVGSSGAIYGWIVPSVNAVNPPEEWNVCEIELVGRWVTITLNGKTVIPRSEIPSITGGALDSEEGEPGALFLQGDHGPVTFRRVSISRPE